MDDDLEDIYQTSLLDRYAAMQTRSTQTRCALIAEFAANYTTRSNHELTEDENTDALPL